MVEVVPDMTVGVLKEQLKTFPADSLETFFLKVDSRENDKFPTVSKFFSWSNPGFWWFISTAKAKINVWPQGTAKAKTIFAVPTLVVW